MHDRMLPSAGRLYAIQARRLTASYRAGISVRTLLVAILAGGALLVVLAVTQVYIARTTRRVVNPGLALATAILLGLVGWISVAFVAQQRALTSAQREGSDPVELLTATRILASRAQADESVALSSRGGGEDDPQLDDIDHGFRAVTAPIGGLLDEAAATSGHPLRTIRAAYRTYVEAHGRVVHQERAGDFTIAVNLAIGGAGAGDNIPTQVAAAALDGALAREIDVAQDRFRSRTADAGGALDGLSGGVPLLTIACALLAMFGLRRRLDEYR
jgi:hypothetical protein